ncbi:MAG: hypothetical protein DYG89_22550 [Caldilinea sp. CFX5]|nr:hypothetical protein [Caldilinea sp. CFX5]
MAISTAYRIRMEAPSGECTVLKCAVDEFTIGSAPHNDLVLQGGGIAPEHLRVRFRRNGEVVVSDWTDEDQEFYPWQLRQLYLVGGYRLWLERDNDRSGWMPAPKTLWARFRHQARLTGRIVRDEPRSPLARRIFFFTLLGLLVALFGWFYDNERNYQVVANLPLLTMTPTPTVTATPTVTMTPTPTPTATATAAPTATFTPMPTATPVILPDTRGTLWPVPAEQSAFGVWFQPATLPIGGQYWKVVSVEWLRGDAANGKSNIYVEVLNAAGGRDPNQSVLLTDIYGVPQITKRSDEKPEDEYHHYACDFPMFNAGPSYRVQIQSGPPSEIVHGLGGGLQGDPRAVASFRVIFQLTTRMQ